MFTLRDYQEEALQSVVHYLDRGIDRQLIVLPTGAGKTVVFSQIPTRVPGRMLVLAHREELLAQAADKIAIANPELNIQIEQAENHADDTADVVIASVPTLGRKASGRITKFPKDHFTTLVVDEAHHAAAPSYKRIVNYFDTDLRLGVTATPQRGDNVRLIDVFDEIVYFRTIQEMIDEGYLVDMVGYRVNTNVDITGITTRNGDYAVKELSDAVNIAQRNRMGVEAYRNLANGKRALVFCVDVAHAFDMAEEFRKAGVSCGTVVGTTPSDERRDLFTKFSAGEISVLTNVNVATEGYDEPAVECVIFARPTRSPVTYSQAVGRGLRLNDDKEQCIVIDLCDVTTGKKPVGLPTLLGLPPDFDAQGRKITEAKEEFDKLEEVSPEEAAYVRSMDDIASAWERIDLFRPPPANETLQEISQFVWMETSSDTYVLHMNNDERVRISSDALGQYRVYLRHANGKEYELTEKTGPLDSMAEAFQRSDRWVQKFRDDQIILLDANAKWRKEPPTEKQLKILRKHNVPITEDMTKGQCSKIIDKLFKENPKKPKPAWLERKIAAERAAKSRW